MNIFRRKKAVKNAENIKFMEIVEAVKKILAENKIDGYWGVSVSYNSYSPDNANLEWDIYSERYGISHCQGETVTKAIAVFKSKIEVVKMGKDKTDKPKDIEVEQS